MNTLEKLYSIFAVLFAVALISLLVIRPEMRQLQVLLPASALGLIINIGLMFIVFRDIFQRRLPGRHGRIFWTALLLLFWPAIVVYLPLHGFRGR